MIPSTTVMTTIAPSRTKTALSGRTRDLLLSQKQLDRYKITRSQFVCTVVNPGLHFNSAGVRVQLGIDKIDFTPEDLVCDRPWLLPLLVVLL